jgi:hypothetical protein
MRYRIPVIIILLLGSVGVSRGQDQPNHEAIQAAIKRGRQFLQATYDPNGGPPPGVGPKMPLMPALAGVGAILNETGPACLAGLAMLETGVPANDPSIKNITAHVRQNALTLKGTYQLSLAIMYLDRLGFKTDTPLIQVMTLRLLTGQQYDGSWSYQCNGLDLSDVDLRLLQAAIKHDAKMTTGPKDSNPLPKKGPMPRQDLDPTKAPPKKDPEQPKEKPPEELKGLHPEVEKLLKLMNMEGRGGTGDHSNTQFATVGLWCGRRHHVDVSKALQAVDKHYRDCQMGDGGWSYTAAGGGGSSPAMTCAGLMGTAIGFGAKNLGGAGGDLGQDKSIQSGLKYLGDCVKAASDLVDRDPRTGRVTFRQNELSTNLYFLWSMERVCMAYGLNTIGKVDWYAWGATMLLTTQSRETGAWHIASNHGAGPVVNTAFALLFLGRANIVQDLSTSLKGKVKDPGTSRLIGGGDLTKLIGGPSGSSGDGGGTTKAPPMPPPLPPPPKSNLPTPMFPPKDNRPDPMVPPKDNRPPSANDFDSRVAKLLRELMNADSTTRAELLTAYRDAKGGEYTEALAQAALKFTGDNQAKTRDALANRLTRMNTATLVEFMRDRNREIRRAAALASGAKDQTRLPEFADALIKALADDEPAVVQAARASLKAFSGQDHGPDPNATIADRTKAIAAWRRWWDSQRK